MPFLIPMSNGEDNAPAAFREFNQCHNPGGPAGGRFCSSGPNGGGDPTARAAAVEQRLASREEQARRVNPEMTVAEKADPDFGKILAMVQNHAETIIERQQAVAIARGFHESIKGMEGYPMFYEDGTPGGSLGKHRGPDGGLTPERAAVHDAIFEHFASKFGPAEASPVVVVTGGLPGAGKSVGIKSVPEYKDFLNINADDIKAMLPEYNGTNAAFLHEESDLLSRRIFEAAVAARQHLVMDVTMKSLGEASKGIRDGLAGRLTAMSTQGYEVQLQFTEVSIDTSVRQALTRYFEVGRFVPPDYIRSARAKGQSASSRNYETFQILRNLPAVKGWKHYTREFGAGAVLYDQGGKSR